MRAIVIAFGSNLGDRDAHRSDAAADAVASLLDNFKLSSDHRNGSGRGWPRERSAVSQRRRAWGSRTCRSREIFEALRAIERQAGRTRPYPGAPRTLDLDLILAGDEVVEEGDLQVPHPRFRDRLFVLDPLAEVAPDLVDPVTH